MVISYIRNIFKGKVDPSISAKQLRLADRALPVPFQINLQDNTPLFCDKVLRQIPRKRLVALGVWNGESIVAKIFFDAKSAKRHFNADVNGVEVLQSSGVPTPKILYKGPSKDKQAWIIIFERIFESRNLDVIWREKPNIESVTPLMRHITRELATQHVLGIVQRDLHLKNFLVSRKVIYTLDGGEIDYQPTILSKEDSIKHLALFFSQLGVGTEKLQQSLFDAYAKSRSWLVRESDHVLLKKTLKKYDESRWEDYQKKIFRNSSDFIRVENYSKLMMYDRRYTTDAFLQFLKNPELAFAHPSSVTLKAGRSSTVIKAVIGKRTFVIKRYNLKNIFHRLRRCLRETRAANSWRLAHKLFLFGVSTARPVAFIENQFLGLRGTSYFVMEYVDGQHLGDFFASSQEDDAIFSDMAKQVIELLTNLSKLSLTHGDLKMTNFIVENNKPVLIDLDGMMEHRSAYRLKRAWKKEMKRFMLNWEVRPTVKALFEKTIQEAEHGKNS